MGTSGLLLKTTAVANMINHILYISFLVIKRENNCIFLLFEFINLGEQGKSRINFEILKTDPSDLLLPFFHYNTTIHLIKFFKNM